MKEFLKNNKVTYNLISFTGFKSMLLFSFLLDGPKSYDEIKEYFANHPYLNETISIDTLRVYINSLERLGCEIVRGRKCEGSKYKLKTHPFEIKLTDDQIKSLIKVFKELCKGVDVEDLLSLQKFLVKISHNISNDDLKNKLLNVSPLKDVNLEILKKLLVACRKNDELEILYNSASKQKRIDILADKISITNHKVYLHGHSPQYKGYTSFLVSKIETVSKVRFDRTICVEPETFVIGCELTDKNVKLLDNEKIISENENSMIIEITSDNKFFARQRILSLGDDCKVLYPQAFSDDIFATLKRMKEEYLAEEI